jgi:arylsulfatase A-like enzyme
MKLLRVLKNDSLALMVLVSHCLLACGSPPHEYTGPVFLADQVTEAEVSFDEARFRSFRKDGRLSDQITLNWETRRSLIPPLPSRLTFDVKIPPDAVLQFSIGVSTLGEPRIPPLVEFRIYADAGNGEELCFDGTVRRFQPNQWLEHELDLSRWSGSNVRLTLETESRTLKQASSKDSRSIAAPFLALWGNPVLTSTSRRPRRPNLFLISIDCLRADHVGAYGYGRATTPNIDRVAADSVVFEEAVATSSWTLPTHMSMLTGLPPSLHGVVGRDHRLGRSVQYLPEFVASAGYEARGIGSSVIVSQIFGFERGFHIYRFLEEPRAGQVIDDALDFVRLGRGHDQFLFLHLIDPHWPYYPPPPFRERFGERPEDISDLHDMAGRGHSPRNRQEIEDVISLYDGEIAYVDQELGRFFEGLKAMGLYDESLIVITSDHGEAFYEHGHWQHVESLYEEVVRVPLIVKWPGGSRKDRISTAVSLIGVFTTFLEQAKVSPRPMSSPPSLRSHLRQTEQSNRDDTIVSEVSWGPLGPRGSWPPPGTSMMISFRREGLKYIATLGEPSQSDPNPRILSEELYDLMSDPRERENLSDNRRAEITSFRKTLRAYLRTARLRGGQPEQVELDPEARRMLESLGYIAH